LALRHEASWTCRPPRGGAALCRDARHGISTDICEHCGGLGLDRLEVAHFEDPATIEVETFDAWTRYSGREGSKERVRV